MCQLEKPPANEITEPLVFTVCNLELRGKAILLHSHVPGAHSLTVVSYEQNETKVTSFIVRNETNQGASTAARVQRGTRSNRGQQWTKQKEKNVLPQNKNKLRRNCCSVVQKCKEAFVSYNEESEDEE